MMAFCNKPVMAGGASGAARSVPVNPDNSDPPRWDPRPLGPRPEPRAPGPAPQGRLQARALPWRPQLTRRSGEPALPLCPLHGRPTAPRPPSEPPPPSAPRPLGGPMAAAPLPHLDSRPMAAALPLHGGGHSAPARRKPGRERRPFRPAPRAGAPRRAEGAAPPGAHEPGQEPSPPRPSRTQRQGSG